MSQQGNRALEFNTTRVLQALERLRNLTQVHTYSMGARDQVITVIETEWNRCKAKLKDLPVTREAFDFKLEVEK